MAMKLSLLGATLLLMLILGEAVLRVAIGPPIIWRYPQESYVQDAEIGYVLAPDQRAFTHDKLFETNSLGIRSPQRKKRNPPNTKRFLAIGDSQTAGDGLLLDDTWPQQLERHLSEAMSSTRFEVLNAGLSGSATWQQAILLERLGAQYDLHGVIVALYVNDVVPRPEHLKAKVVTNTIGRRLGYIVKRSALVTAIWSARRTLPLLFAPETNESLETRVLTGQSTEGIEAGWKQIETSLGAIRSYARRADLDFWILILPRRDQVDGSQTGRAYNQRAAEIARRMGIPAVDVLEPLTEAFEEHGRDLFIPWDGHNSEIANGIIARELAAAIAERS
jgi:hypothetical protein